MAMIKNMLTCATLAVLLFFASFSQFSCSRVTDPPQNDRPYRVNDYNLNELSYGDLPYVWQSLGSLDYSPRDSLGVPLFEYRGATYYHPLTIVQKLFVLIDSYRKSNEPEYLSRSVILAKKLLEIADNVNCALYYPYSFNYDLHGIKGETMIAPWYSGMAQGQALSGLVRLFEITGDSTYLHAATFTLHSFTLFQGEHDPWIVFIDNQGYYWIEEYPLDRGRTMALNGFIFGIFGLYDYWLLTKDPECENLLKAGITTIEKYISEYRNAGGISYYCLRHKEKYAEYHRIHTDQLHTLYLITGSQFFLDMYNNFYNDYH